MALIEGIKIDGGIIKESLSGIGGLVKDIRTALTGKLDPSQAAALELKLAEMELQTVKAQTDINAIEAANPNVFVSGWRPFIGWVCGFALAVYYIPQALMATALWTIQCSMVMHAATDIAAVILPQYPIIFNVAEILGLVGSLLGLSISRSIEKTKNVSRS